MKKGLPGLISYEEPGYVKWFLRGLFLPCGAGFCLGQRNNERWTCQKYLLPIFLTIFVTAMGFVIEPYFLDHFKVRVRQAYKSKVTRSWTKGNISHNENMPKHNQLHHNLHDGCSVKFYYGKALQQGSFILDHNYWSGSDLNKLS